MNNKQLNREFSQVMSERNKSNISFKKSGFTDSEDEDEITTKCNYLFILLFFCLIIYI